MTNVVYLFPDTNVLVQCLPLEQVDWSAWRGFDEVHLIITRPVQAEIDDQKNKGKERLARRARKASTLLREILLSGQGCHVIRPADPSVKLLIKGTIRPSRDLDVLDYARPDDQLVGTAHNFAQQNPGLDVRVLTHDTGPLASAQAVGVSVAPVPDDWLLPPETSEADKKIHALQAEVAKLKDAEPKIRIACIDFAQNEVNRLEFVVTRYHPLSSAEISALMERIKDRFPIAGDFGARESVERAAEGIQSLIAIKEVFTPATDEQIETYRKNYGIWLRQCEATLRRLHVALEANDGAPVFIFSADNEGTRPANGVLITLAAKGRFRIMPSSELDDDEDDDDETEGHEDTVFELPNPPSPPQGFWKPVSIFDALDVIRKFQFGSDVLMPRRPLFPTFEPPSPRDPNAFYYKPDRPCSPQLEYNPECDQWRHRVRAELFMGEIHFDANEGEVSGALECRIHAQNLSESVVKLIPVSIKIKHAKASTVAAELVNSLCNE